MAYQKKVEVDFILYGHKGFLAFEVKLSSKLRQEDFDGLELFSEDYPQAKLYLIYGGSRKYQVKNITVLPAEEFFQTTQAILSML